MKLVFSHPTGNANVRAAASAFMEAGLLHGFHTTLASFPGSFLDKLGAFGPLSEIRRRRFNPVLRPVTKTWPWLEMGRLAASRTGFSRFNKHESGFFCIDAVYQNLDKRVASNLKKAARNGAEGVYAFEDGAVFSFREAKAAGLQCFYDLPTGYWRAARRLLESERDRWPDWTPTMTGFIDSCKKLEVKDEELRLADKIIVASQFTARTLQEFPGQLAPVETIPYGFPPINSQRRYNPIKKKGPLKLLFVGKLGQQKGVADLFAAVEGLRSHVTLTVVGHKASENCRPLNEALAKHRWIPSLPHAEILQLMREHEVLIFPSLFDGFGLVITEAMAQGTPVIATDRTAGPDLITHGHNGWLVEAASTQALQAAIEELLIHPELIAEAGRGAMETAGLRPWALYKEEVVAAIKKDQLIES